MNKKKLYRRTLKGVISRNWEGMIDRSKKRGHLLPNFSKEDFIHWCYSQGITEIYMEYVESGYDKNLRPSVDRLDNNLPYTFSNMQLITWKENNLKEGNKEKLWVPVSQFTKSGEWVADYVSQTEAARQLGANKNLISQTCLGNRKTHFGYIWKFKE